MKSPITIGRILLRRILLFSGLLCCCLMPAFAQGVDQNTLLLLNFENSLSGEQGETPISAAGYAFQTGVNGQGVSLPAGNQLVYPAVGNVNAVEGTIEFWIKPSWNGSDNLAHTIFDWNGSSYGGMRIHKFGSAGLVLSMDRFQTWKEIGTNVNSWQTGQWHHVAFTFSNTTKTQKVYIDGALKNQTTFTGDLPPITDANFRIGSNLGGSNVADAVLDQFRISNKARSAQEIYASFNTFTVNSIILSAVTTNLWQTWRIPVTINAETNIGSINFPSSPAIWTSSNPNVATINAEGQILGVGTGTATLTANVNGATKTINVRVNAPVLPPRVDIPTGFRATPAANSLYEIPVISLRYLPTKDGINLDTDWCPGFYGLEPISLATLEQNQNYYDEIRKFMLEEGSRFHGYGSQTPLPSLGYRVVATITVYEPPPPGKIYPYNSPNSLPIYSSEMFQMFERLGIQNYVENQGVKEIWYYTGQLDSSLPSYNPVIHPPENFRFYWESNMASPSTGDVSNSDRDNSDLPIYNRTYIVCVQLLRRFDTTIHVDGHQLERILEYINYRQDGNNNLFVQKFVGYDANGTFQRGRSGNVHFPPNGTSDYDYNNFTPFSSDITDWKPDGSGTKIPYSAATVRDTPYIFPNNFLPTPRIESHWHIFWRQSMPGFGNTIPYQTSSGANRMTNWWQFTGDWDRAIRSGVGLYEPASCSYALSSTSQNFSAAGGNGSVTVTSGSGCKWFASNNAPWTPLVSGDLGNGNGTVNFTVAPNTSSDSRSTKIIIAGQIFTITQASARQTSFDFDGDRRADVSVFRPLNGAWYLQQSQSGFAGMQFGIPTDKIVPADYDGDGKTDIAVYRSGVWYLQRSQLGFTGIQFGVTEDIPQPADFDGDGKADLAVFRPSNGTWYLLQSIAGFTGIQFGQTGDRPVAADYDGDGKTDVAVYRNGIWYINRSQLGLTGLAFGEANDKPVPADYDGDGKADVAVFRPSSGSWYLQQSQSGFTGIQFGIPTDLPAPADFDGDAKADIAVFRDGVWYLNRSTQGFTGIQFGTANDKPIPNAFVP